MSLAFVLATVGLVGAIVTIVIAAFSRHMKAATRTLKLVGEVALVDSQLDPEGTVLVSGELWRAKSKNGRFISSHQRVRVVGFQELLLLVEVCD